VSDIDRIAEHERAAADDAVDLPRVALSNGLFRDAAAPKGPMEPHASHPMLTTLSNDLD
jgi:hypothetical protein